MKHSDKENVYEPNLNIMTPLTQNWVKNGPEFVNDVLTVIERSNSITIQYLRRAIHFSGQN